ncbi:MAG TPA: hypothetical protein VEZ43_02735 [Dongiaceae bacterium]|nr:hypothetical protein [Dongiaceae bacterium]
MTIYAQMSPQATESGATTIGTFPSIPIPDFTIGATLPSIVLADGTTSATATIIVGPIYGFTGTVTLSDLPLPADLLRTAIEPATITSSGSATLSCRSIAARTYKVTIIGTSGGIRHDATATFTFADSASPDFRVSAITPVSMTADTTAASSLTVTSEGGFDSQVNLTAAVYPSIGLSVSLGSQSFVYGSGTSTATFSSSTPGDYTVTIGVRASRSRTRPRLLLPLR